MPTKAVFLVHTIRGNKCYCAYSFVISNLESAFIIPNYWENRKSIMEKTENYPTVVNTEEHIKIRIAGNKKDLSDFTRMLAANGIPHFTEPVPKAHQYSHKFVLNEDAEFQRLIAPGPEEMLAEAAKIVVVELTKEAARAILRWLKRRTKKHREPDLVVTYKGQRVRLNREKIRVFRKILDEPSAKSARGRRPSSKNGHSKRAR